MLLATSQAYGSWEATIAGMTCSMEIRRRRGRLTKAFLCDLVLALLFGVFSNSLCWSFRLTFLSCYVACDTLRSFLASSHTRSVPEWIIVVMTSKRNTYRYSSQSYKYLGGLGMLVMMIWRMKDQHWRRNRPTDGLTRAKQQTSGKQQTKRSAICQRGRPRGIWSTCADISTPSARPPARAALNPQTKSSLICCGASSKNRSSNPPWLIAVFSMG